MGSNSAMEDELHPVMDLETAASRRPRESKGLRRDRLASISSSGYSDASSVGDAIGAALELPPHLRDHLVSVAHRNLPPVTSLEGELLPPIDHLRPPPMRIPLLPENMKMEPILASTSAARPSASSCAAPASSASRRATTWPSRATRCSASRRSAASARRSASATAPSWIRRSTRAGPTWPICAKGLARAGEVIHVLRLAQQRHQLRLLQRQQMAPA